MVKRDKNKTYVFADGQNFLGSSREEFKVDIALLKKYLSELHPTVKRSFWYDVEPEIFWAGIKRSPTDNLDSLLRRSREERTSLEILLTGSEGVKAFSELVKFYESFDNTLSEYEKRKYFLEKIIGRNYELVLGAGKEQTLNGTCPSCGDKSKLVRKTDGGITDTYLSTDLVYHAAKDSYDWAILLTSDGDFARTVSYVKSLGKKVAVASFERSTSYKLRDVADEFINLTNLREQIQLKNGS